jgi:hypothetical protein
MIPDLDEVEERLRRPAGEPVPRELDEHEVHGVVHVYRIHSSSAPTAACRPPTTLRAKGHAVLARSG